MNIKEEKGNLFNTSNDYFLAHCISLDFAMGAGIAVEFNKRFKLRKKLNKISNIIDIEVCDCVLIDRVFNLITKEKYFQKPTYQSLEKSLLEMKRIIIENKIKKLAMPKIACGLDRLQWGKVKEIIEVIFEDVDIDILIRTL